MAEQKTPVLPSTRRTLTIYLPDLSGGGAERLHARLLPEFLRLGFDVTFLLDRERGELLAPVRALGARVVSLGADRQLKALPKLTKYLKSQQPDILISNMEHMNVMAVWARRLARVRTKIIVTQHNTFSEQARRRSWQWRVLPRLYRLALPSADRIVAVSEGVADDLATVTGIARQRMTVIYNGVVTEDFAERAEAAVDHAWFGEGQPTLLAMGRMVEQKDYPTLLEALTRMQRRDARLLILGDGPLRPSLEALIARLGLSGRVDLLGFREDALAFLNRADLFVLSSKFEGFGNVVAEALACGTAVVSTDCPHGPAEILDHGRFGRLVPVGNAERLAKALDEALAAPDDPGPRVARGQLFSVRNCARTYAEVMS